MNRDLYLFTSEFPYGNGEKFIQSEIDILSEHFNKIFLIPNRHPSVENTIPLQKNVQVLELNVNHYTVKQKFVIASKNIIFIMQLLISEGFTSRQKKLSIRNLKKNFSLLIALCVKANEFQKKMKSTNPVFYTYWFSTDAILLSILVKRKSIEKYFSRAHGFDLYENNGKENYIPFRILQLKCAHSVFCVSKTGMNYLKDLYPKYGGKIRSSYLGVFDHGTCPFKKEQDNLIVTCSNIVPVKRLDLLVEALSLVKNNITWIHFGSGYLMEEILKQINHLPKNVTVEMKGQVSNEKIIEFYKSKNVTAFINTSISEGIPVSMMEAISFGIPIIATNVGGVSEIVNDRTGILLDANFEPSYLAKLLDELSTSSFTNTIFRKDIRQFYQEKFSAQKNYTSFSYYLN